MGIRVTSTDLSSGGPRSNQGSGGFETSASGLGLVSGLASGIRERMAGPGGLYNSGNAIALAAGLAVQLAQRPEGTGTLSSIWAYLFGNPGAAFLTLAMIIFFWSGEVYHRAWRGRSVPDQQLNRRGDLISAFGAAALTIALVQFGDMVLALVAGVLLAGGKLGTAFPMSGCPGAKGTQKAELAFRLAVAASRFPSFAVLILELVRIAARGGSAADAFLPATMLFCFGLWFWADVVLFRGDLRKPSGDGEGPDAARGTER